jgi:hypothetical protein
VPLPLRPNRSLFTAPSIWIELYLLFRPAALKPLPLASICGERRAKSPNVRAIEGMVSMMAV